MNPLVQMCDAAPSFGAQSCLLTNVLTSLDLRAPEEFVFMQAHRPGSLTP